MLNSLQKNRHRLSPPPSQPPTYAEAAKKHLLIVKSTDNSHRASEKKKEISTALKGLQIIDAKFKQSGNVILNFESEHQRNEAAAKVGELDNLSANKTKVLLPKICYVMSVRKSAVKALCKQ